VDLRRLRLSLVALQLVSAATLLRSIAYDRWITVLASVLMMVGATAALRGRSWGIALGLAAAAAFPVAFAIGIAPAWFCLVGAAGALPFVLASRAFARFDKTATVLLAALAGSAGALGAVAWKQYAWDIFEMFPSSLPSREAQHGLALVAVLASTAVAMRLGRKGLGGLGERARVRVGPGAGERLRVSDDAHADAEAAIDTDDGADADAGVHEPRRARL
jgi:hypothetical protein